MAVERTNSELVTAFLEAIDGFGNREAGRFVEGVTHDDISRWRRGEWQRLSTRKREALVAYLRQRNGGAEEETPEQATSPSPLDEWVQDFEARVRNVGGKVDGISEYERKARIRDAIAGQIQALQMLGDPVPARLYELREMAERGEL